MQSAIYMSETEVCQASARRGRREGIASSGIQAFWIPPPLLVVHLNQTSIHT